MQVFLLENGFNVKIKNQKKHQFCNCKDKIDIKIYLFNDKAEFLTRKWNFIFDRMKKYRTKNKYCKLRETTKKGVQTNAS